MKKLILTCALIMSVSVVSFAQAQSNAGTTIQTKATAEELADRNTKAYEKQLSLTAEQSKAIHDVELSFIKQSQQMHAGGATPSQGQLMQHQMSKDHKMKQILTADQYTTYQASAPNVDMPGKSK
jgi:Spy/CpxP family protein refolding chaperone